MTEAPHSAGSLLRKIVAAVILVPLAIVIVAFAIANHEGVTVSFDPFNSKVPAGSVTAPLFVVIIVVLILGVVIGGAAAWLGQGRWRRAARRLEREAGALRGELDALKRAAGAAPVAIPEAAAPPARLKLRPPAS